MKVSAAELFPTNQCGGQAVSGPNSNNGANCTTGISGGPANPAHQGARIELSVIVTYPGSRVSDVLIGGQKFQIPNEALRRAMEECA